MKTADFDYDLPQELIAQDPLEQRDSSRLLILDKETGERTHKIFHDIIDYLHEGDCLVINNTKVIPARLIGEREGTGGKVEVLLLKRRSDNVWETLVKPGKKARPGMRLSFGGGLLHAEVQEVVDEGNRLIRFEYEAFLRKSSISSDRCRCLRISRISSRIRTVIRRYMPSTRDRRLHRRQVFILRRSCLSRFRQRGLRLPESRFMSDLEPFDRSRWRM